MLKFICYPKCTTCQKARKWLDEKGVKYEFRNIKDEKPNIDEIKEWHRMSGLSLKMFFNTSGLLYKSMSLKDRLHSMDEAEQIELLASDGMMVKRPILVDDGFVLVGFKEADWNENVKYTSKK